MAYIVIAGNPNIKAESKPHSAKQIMKLTDDREIEVPAPTKEEVEKVKQMFSNGISQ
jgi:intein-encoded DNA endonuclease-like protein